MKTKSILSEFVVLLLLSLVPLPGPPVLRAPCPRDRSAVVRNIVNKKWIPILKQYGLKLPLECPFHPVRDIFWPRQVAKIRHRPSQWSCGLCGKSFYSERFLEHHFENRHPDHLNTAEEAVCLADYCDVMRCAVWEAAATSKGASGQASNTDLELWKESSALIVANSLSQPSPTALQSVPVAVTRGELAPYPATDSGAKAEKSKSQRPPGPHCTSNSRKKASSTPLDGENSTLEEDQRPGEGGCTPGSTGNPTGGSSLNHMQRFKADCRPEQLLLLRTRCEGLVWDCIAGLLTNLSTEEFKTIEGEMNRAVCWYLTCDRYWENAPNERRRFPWALLLALVTALALVICLCYYLIWLMCDSDEQGLVREGSMSQPSSPTMQARGMYTGEEEAEYYADNLGAASAQGEHYIYVTYPPELKRRLMESCYSRTTRL